MQILVLGMHRSGTSAVTRLINMMGAYFGPEGSASEITSANPKGFWERFDVYTLNDALLKAKGCTWYNLQRWQFKDIRIIPANIAASIQKIVLGMDAFRPFVLKDPRLCLLLPAWRPYLEVPLAVIVYRDPAEISLSLQTRDRLPLEYGMALWEYYAVGMLNASQTIPRLFIRHADLLAQPQATCQTIYEWLIKEGARRLALPSRREVEAFIDPKLYRSRPGSAQSPALSMEQRALTELLQGLRPQQGPVQVSAAAQAIIQAQRS